MAIVAPDIPIDELVTGEKFELLCDVDAEKNPEWENAIKRCSNETVTVFSQTHELIHRIPIIREINKKIIMVTHNSDGHIQYEPSRRYCDYQWKNEGNIVHWFCQNCDVNEPNVTPIPIGLENTYVFKPEVKQQYMINTIKAGINKEFKMFICYNPETNPGERKPPIAMFSKLPWVIHVEGFNNIGLVKQFFDNMAKCKFCLCPDGNGVDTIRMWEAIYMGCIPIVKPHTFTEYFAKHLPVLIVKSWDEINIGFLVDKFYEMKEKAYNYDVLKMSYWKNEIKKRIEEC